VHYTHQGSASTLIYIVYVGSVYQCVEVFCIVLQCTDPSRQCAHFDLQNLRWECVAVCCSVLQCVAVCCSLPQCVAVCCNVLQCTIPIKAVRPL